MVHDNKLYIPIQINGGELNPNNAKVDLKDRELYLCTADMKIYAKNEAGKIVQLNANKADVAEEITGDNFKLFSTSSKHSKIGKFYVNSSGLSGNESENTYPIISHFNIDKLKSIVLDKKMYGSALPEDGTEGQLFFKR